MIATLRRTEKSRDGIFGQLYIPNGRGLHLCTCEDDEDAIPAGSYVCLRTIYHKHNVETFEITDVPLRSRILFHVGNTEEDTRGCVLVGMRRGSLWVPDEDTLGRPLKRKTAVVSSREAFSLFMSRLEEVDEFNLQLTEAFPH